MDAVAIALSLEILPHRADLHELGRFALQLLHSLKKAQRPGVALPQSFFEIALVAQVPPVKHEGIDVAPYFGEIGRSEQLAIEIGRGGNRQIDSYFGPVASMSLHRRDF